MSRLALKFLTERDTGPYSDYEWPVPNGKPGKWVSCKGDLIVCRNGIHACTLPQAVDWLRAHAYVIELGGKVVDENNKLCARKGRLVRKLDWNPRLFAADCAEHVLPIFEKKHPDDDRPRRAIEAARAYERGEIDAAARTAARTAAWTAARDAAQAAVWDAARAAAWDAAQAAVWDAAQDAAQAVAWAAARTAARTAAWDAAQAAAWDAAWDAAQAAAWDAAWDAAWAAAWDAAQAAEREWQTTTLARHLSLTKAEIKELWRR